MQIYPGTLNSFTNPAGTQTLDNPDHAGQHGDLNDAIEAHEAVLGTNSGTSVLKHFTAGQFPVRATGVAAIGTLKQTIVGGTYNNTIIGTSAITGGTVNNPTIGTPAITGGTANSITLGTVTGTPVLGQNIIQGSNLATSSILLGTASLGTGIISTTSSTDDVVVPGLIGTVTVPSGGRSVKTTLGVRSIYNDGAAFTGLSIWYGSVVSGTLLGRTYGGKNQIDTPASVVGIHTPSAGLGTYTVGIVAAGGGTAHITNTSTEKAILIIELI